MGLVKSDLLGLGMLAALQYCFDLVREHTGEEWTLATIPKEEAGVYEPSDHLMEIRTEAGSDHIGHQVGIRVGDHDREGGRRPWRHRAGPAPARGC